MASDNNILIDLMFACINMFLAQVRTDIHDGEFKHVENLYKKKVEVVSQTSKQSYRS